MLNQLICIPTRVTGKIADGCPLDGLISMVRRCDRPTTLIFPRAEKWRNEPLWGRVSGTGGDQAQALPSLQHWHCGLGSLYLRQS